MLSLIFICCRFSIVNLVEFNEDNEILGTVTENRVILITINGITSMSLIYLGILICNIIQSGSLFGYRNCEYVVLKIVIINIRIIQYVA